MADLTPTHEVRKMINGNSAHYRVTDKLRKDNTRYFIVRGNSDLCKTFKSLVRNTTNYNVVNCEIRDNGFRAEIEKE